MIIHLFNSSSVSGPERLVLPALASIREQCLIINLREERLERLRDLDPLEEYARSLGLDYCDIRVCGHWDYVAVRDLRVLLERLDPDLVHAHDFKASAYLLHAQRGLPGHRFRVVSTHHGVHGRPSVKTRFYEWFYRRYILKSFDRTFCVSTADYEFMIGSGISRDRLRLHLNGIDGRLVESDQRAKEMQQIRARWLPEEPNRDSLFLFGMIGRLSAEKDHARLLGILSYLHHMPADKDWRCLIFGTGDLEKSLKRRAQQLGLEKRLLWMGYRNDVGAELAGLDLVLSLSKAEGLPINIIEAGWAGTPVMCTRVGGIRDLIPDERYGSWIPPGESVIASAYRLRRCLTAEGREKLQDQALRFQRRATTEFTQAKWLQSMKELYLELAVNIAAPGAKSMMPWPRENEAGQDGFGERLQTTLFTRLLLYPTGRLEDIRKWNQNGFRILMYHRFSSSTPGIQDALAKQCAHIASHYKPVSLTDIGRSLETGIPLPPNSLAVTVDDGYRDFLCNGYPVFRSYKIPVTVFLVSGFLDGESWLWWDQLHFAVEHTRKPSARISLSPDAPAVDVKLMTPVQRRNALSKLTEVMKSISNRERLKFIKNLPDMLDVVIPSMPPPALAPLEWSETRYLAENGVDFGAHTRTHPILSRIEQPELEAEIAHSHRRIEEELRKPVLHFSYPNGRREDVKDGTWEILRQHKFLTAVTAEKGVNFNGAHPFWLRRIGVDPLMSKFNFEVLLAGLGGGRSKQVPYSMAHQEQTVKVPIHGG